MTLVEPNAQLARRARDRRSMNLLATLVYPVFLVLALFGRLVPPSKGRLRRSLWAEAADATQSVVPWFFVFR